MNAATNSLGPVRVLWPSPFTVLSIISNRMTQLHRDTKGIAPFYDIVTTLGRDSDGVFEVPGIGLRFEFCGKVLAHKVAGVEGDKFCVVQYVHKKVLEHILEGLEGNEWMQQSDLIFNIETNEEFT